MRIGACKSLRKAEGSHLTLTTLFFTITVGIRDYAGSTSSLLEYSSKGLKCHEKEL